MISIYFTYPTQHTHDSAPLKELFCHKSHLRFDTNIETGWIWHLHILLDIFSLQIVMAG